jgi:tetratricopeptide (TPR) repeat protein
MIRAVASAVAIVTSLSLVSLASARDAEDAPVSAPSISPDDAYDRLLAARNLDKPESDSIRAAVTAASIEQPADPRWRIALAVFQRIDGDAKGSVESLTALAKQFPAVAEIRFQLGQSLMSTLSGDMGFLKMADVAGDARDAWLEAVEIDPNHVMARFAVSQYELQARKQGGFLFGSYRKAKAQGEALLKIPGDKGLFWGHMALAAVASAQEEWDDMASHYTAAENAAPDEASLGIVLFSHANALMNDKKDPAAALPLAERAIAAGTADQTTGYFLRGSIRRAQGDCPGAMADFSVVLEKNPAAQNTRAYIADCCEKTGDPAAALAHYEEYLRRFPSGQHASTAKAAVKRLKKT